MSNTAEKNTPPDDLDPPDTDTCTPAVVKYRGICLAFPSIYRRYPEPEPEPNLDKESLEFIERTTGKGGRLRTDLHGERIHRKERRNLAVHNDPEKDRGMGGVRRIVQQRDRFMAAWRGESRLPKEIETGARLRSLSNIAALAMPHTPSRHPGRSVELLRTVAVTVFSVVLPGIPACRVRISMPVCQILMSPLN